MHKRILEDATPEQVREFATNFICELMEEHPSIYERAEDELYRKVYGCHFNEWMLKEAVDQLENEDGTEGAHWTLEQTNSVAESMGIEFDDFNKYDWNYAMNVIYSDYFGAVPNETKVYAKMGLKFLKDKDYGKNKAYMYYRFVMS